MSTAPSSPPPAMPLPARIVAALFTLAALLALAAVPLAWTLLGAETDAGGISREVEFRGRIVFLAIGCALAAIYAGAAWFIWTGRNWKVAMLLSIGAIFGFPIGTVISVTAIVVLSLRSVRAAFRVRAGERGH